MRVVLLLVDNSIIIIRGASHISPNSIKLRFHFSILQTLKRTAEAETCPCVAEFYQHSNRRGSPDDFPCPHWTIWRTNWTPSRDNLQLNDGGVPLHCNSVINSNSLTVHHQPLAEHKKNGLVLRGDSCHLAEELFGSFAALQLKQLNVAWDEFRVHFNAFFQHLTGLHSSVGALIQLAQVEVSISEWFTNLQCLLRTSEKRKSFTYRCPSEYRIASRKWYSACRTSRTRVPKLLCALL